MDTTTKTRFHNLELDARLAQAFEENRQRIIVNAENYAARNQPPSLNRNLKAYFEEDHLRYQSLVDKVNAELQFKTSCHEVVEHQKVTENRLRTVNNELTTEKEEQIAIDAKLKNQRSPFSMLRIFFVWMATALVCLFDGILAIPVFEEAWGYSWIESVVCGLLFAFALAIISHCFEWIVLFGKTLWQRRFIAFSLLSLLLLLFYFMASHRVANLEKQIADNSLVVIHLSPWPFTLLSLLLFLVALTLNHKYYPTREQRAAMREYQMLTKEKQKNEAEQDRLKKEKAAIEKDHNEVKQRNASILEYGCMLEELIVSHAYGGFALWKKQNMMHRPDNGRPISFDEPNYPFVFNTNFHSIKNLHQS